MERYDAYQQGRDGRGCQRHGAWWRPDWPGPRSAEHLSAVLADLYPRALDRLRRNRRLHEGEAYEIASRIVQRLIDEYERGKTYRVHPHIVVGNYCMYLTKEYLAEQQYTRCDSLDATRPDPDSGESTPLIAEPVDPSRAIDDQVADEHFVQKMLAHEAMTPKDVEVLDMRYLQGMDIGDMAKLLGIERNAVDQRIHRALKRARDLSLCA
jgi:RNA polymerase sigma factor (sigma-70 family)